MLLENLIKAYLNRASITRYSLEANYLNPTGSVYVNIDNSDKCYSTQERGYWYGDDTKYAITLGLKFYPTIRKVKGNYEIPIDKQSPVYSDISMMYDAVFFHELGHILYTPMALTKESFNTICKQGGTQFANLFASVANIVEDVVIEGEIKYFRPQTTYAIDHLRKVAFNETPEEITSDLKGALNVILYNFRAIKPTVVAYPDKDIQKLLLTYMYVCINTQDPCHRMYRELAFAAALWDVFNCKEKPHYTNYKKGLDSTFYNNLPDKYKDKEDNDSVDKDTGLVKGMSNLVNSGLSKNNNPSSTVSHIPIENDGEVDNPAKEVEEEAKIVSRNEGFSDPTKTQDIKPNTDIDEREVLQMAHNDVICDRTRHRFQTIKGRYDSSYLINEYLNVVSKYSLMINQIADLIKKRKNWNNTHWEEGKTSGKLNDKAFYKRTHKIYKQRSLPKREADLAFSILVDNSGSMCGMKTRICGEALIVLSEVCNKLKIPFEVNAFTEAGEAITIGLKSFEDDFNKVKTNLSLIQQQKSVPGLSMFCGNIDEINLEFVWRNFRKRKEKDKIIIVISDGQTCGSEKELKNLANTIHKDKITILGLGIKSDCVDRIYAQHKTFHSDEDLNMLPKFLNDYLVKNIFKPEIKNEKESV